VEHGYYAEYRAIEERHWWFRGRREVLLRLLDRRLPPGDASRRVLDIGCERGVERVQRLESQTLPWEAETFDLVTALDVIEHIDDDLAILREVERVLRPGGTALLTVPAYEALWGPQDEISHHKRRYRAGQLRERMEEAGLAPLKLSYFNSLLFPPIAAVRLLRPRRAGDGELKSDFTLTRPGRLNEVLARVFASEAALVERWNLPFGVSIVALARKETARR
jgi:SAM-dependent methyltransferase